MPVVSHFIGAVIDCPDPRKLAAFYQALTGWAVIYEDDDEAVAIGPDADDPSRPGIGFQRVEGYTAPLWPGQEVPQQAHLDFFADDDLDTAEAAALVLGATTAAHQPQPDRWRVMLDPAGHPFCLCVSPEQS
jgi:catechol 2,3-dioxygenase-like lactoylglutathione lyase family enzyme